MIRTPIIHPELLAGLARLGHGSQVLVADALFPHATGANPAAPCVNLNLTAGTVPAAQIVGLLGQMVQLEAATFMFDPGTDDGESPAVADFRASLSGHLHWGGKSVDWSGLDRFAFYEACRAPSVGLVIASGEVRPYANLLLTIGVP